jgi:anti-sigma factor RsiW
MHEPMNASICQRGNDLISFLYGEADEHEAQDFGRHLAQCAECTRELTQFREIRDGVIAWRQESLGVLPMLDSELSRSRFGYSEKPSALAAVRQFFDLSPLWLKGAVAFAGILFCVATVFMVANLREKPEAAVVPKEKLYSEKELQAKVEEGIQSRLQQLSSQKENVHDVQPPRTMAQNQPVKPKSGEAAATGKTRRAPLTRSEREQLAADLRLITTGEDSELNLLGEQINR